MNHQIATSTTITMRIIAHIGKPLELDAAAGTLDAAACALLAAELAVELAAVAALETVDAILHADAAELQRDFFIICGDDDLAVAAPSHASRLDALGTAPAAPAVGITNSAAKTANASAPVTARLRPARPPPARPCIDPSARHLRRVSEGNLT